MLNNMRKFLFAIMLCFCAITLNAQKTWFVGGQAGIGYVDSFNFAIEPQVGYEFTDRWAVGTGLGFNLVSSSGYNSIIGVFEPFVRFCAWHNEIVFIDLKATAGLGFDNQLELCQIGIRPSLRFRLNEHWDMSADLGLFGTQYTYYGGWTPAFGVSATSASLWVAYRF